MLGIVIPCYRQEAWLPRTLRALEGALEGHAWQGVIVMSAPGAAIPAAPGGWTVIAPPVSRALTPGAARMLGFAACGGTHVLFVDADVEVDAAWVEAALARAQADASLAALWGRLEEWFEDDTGVRAGSDDLLRIGMAERDVDYLTAVALYRRDALIEAGGYDARLSSEEDFELGMRMRRLGRSMRALGMRAGKHWSAPRPSLKELTRRWRTGLCFGTGQVLRLYLGRPGFLTLLHRQGLYLATLATWTAGLAALLAWTLGAGRQPFAIWSVCAAACLAALAWRKRSVRLAAYSVCTWTLNGLGMLVGLLRGLEPGVPPGMGRPA